MTEKHNNELAEKIYRVLTNKKFRTGMLPVEHTKKLILEKICLRISENQPVKIFQFWGGCKNSNLPTDSAELCEQAALDNLQKLNNEIAEIYRPGLKIFISPGDGRVQHVNHIPKEKTEKYVKTLSELAQNYDGLFSVIPISTLYEKYSADFNKCLAETETRIGKDICKQPDFDKLASNAKKNIYTKNLRSEEEIFERSQNAAKDYIIYRVAEEEAEIFREFDDCIRSFFIRYTPFYKTYIRDIDKTKPRLDCLLTFYTGNKGNITQPWQALGKQNEGKILFLSQNRLNAIS